MKRTRSALGKRDKEETETLHSIERNRYAWFGEGC